MYSEETKIADNDLLGTVQELEKAVATLNIALHGEKPETTTGIGNTPINPTRNRFEQSREIIRDMTKKIFAYADEIRSI